MGFPIVDGGCTLGIWACPMDRGDPGHPGDPGDPENPGALWQPIPADRLQGAYGAQSLNLIVVWGRL